MIQKIIDLRGSNQFDRVIIASQGIKLADGNILTNVYMFGTTNEPAGTVWTNGNYILVGTNVPTVNVNVDGTYPVFRIDVGLIDGNWTDFEIKGSTNNFTNLVYYYQSWTPTQLLAGVSDTNTLTYFTDDYATDVRRWNKQILNIAIGDQVANVSSSVVQWVYFYPSHDCQTLWSTWMYKTNKNLVWSYVRADNLGPETNIGSKEKWSPIRPESWEIERTIP